MATIIWDADYLGLREAELPSGPHAEMRAISACPSPANRREAAEYIRAAASGCQTIGSGTVESPALCNAVRQFGGSCACMGVIFVISSGGRRVRIWAPDAPDAPRFRVREVW